MLWLRSANIKRKRLKLPKFDLSAFLPIKHVVVVYGEIIAILTIKWYRWAITIINFHTWKIQNMSDPDDMIDETLTSTKTKAVILSWETGKHSINNILWFSRCMTTTANYRRTFVKGDVWFMCRKQSTIEWNSLHVWYLIFRKKVKETWHTGVQKVRKNTCIALNQCQSLQLIISN